MRTTLLAGVAIAAIVLAGIAAAPATHTVVGARPASAGSGAATPGPMMSARSVRSIAGYPDRGQLFVSDMSRRTVHNGASTWRPVRVSEAHALRAIAEGGMTVLAPNGQPIRLNYERHIEHPDGNWTWIGRQQGGDAGTESVLTFGEKAMFGVIRQGDTDLRLTTEGGSTWLVETDDRQFDGNSVAASDDDFLVPQETASSMAMRASARRDGDGAIASAAGVAADAPALTTTVDVVVGYSSGFAARLGGQSQAQTRIDYLVDLTNQAYLASSIDARIRIVHTMEVDYPDATTNSSTLRELTGVDCITQVDGDRYLTDRRVTCTPMARPAGLEPLAAARETYGADLIALVRKFEDPENASCGAGWLLGGGQNPIDADDAAYAVSVTSDSSGEMFPDNSNTCPELHLAHELGHNMGQQHDVKTAADSDDSDNNGTLLDPEEYGRHRFSFGYSTDGTAHDLFTIMSIRRPGQARYRVFSNPRINTCGDAPCGTTDRADNARSMTATMPVVAAFRATIVPFGPPNADFNGDARSDILWRSTTDGHNAIWRSANYATQQAVRTVSSQAWKIAAVGDFNGDGQSDLVWRDSTTGKNVLWRTANYATQQALTTVASQAWTIAGVGDFNGDGKADLLWRNTTDGKNVIWRSANSATGQIVTQVPSQDWKVAGIGDFDGDGVSDILWRNNSSGKNAIWRSGNSATQRGVTAVSTSWIVAGVGDFNGDGMADILWRNTADGRNTLWRSGDSAASTIITAVTNQAWEVAKVGDFNFDGYADILWRNASNGANTIWKAANYQTQQAVKAVATTWEVAG